MPTAVRVGVPFAPNTPTPHPKYDQATASRSRTSTRPTHLLRIGALRGGTTRRRRPVGGSVRVVFARTCFQPRLLLPPGDSRTVLSLSGDARRGCVGVGPMCVCWWVHVGKRTGSETSLFGAGSGANGVGGPACKGVGTESATCRLPPCPSPPGFAANQSRARQQAVFVAHTQSVDQSPTGRLTTCAALIRGRNDYSARRFRHAPAWQCPQALTLRSQRGGTG